MNHINIFILGGIFSIILSKIFNKKQIEMYGGSNIIDLTNIKPNIKDNNKNLEIYTKDNDKFSPMFINPLLAKKISPTNSIHLVIPGILPAPTQQWKNYKFNTIFYMPNDFKPHFHGKATHHMNGGFKINRAFSLLKNNFVKTDKTLSNYRYLLNKFNKGLESTPIETWIHWKIPSNNLPYPELIVRKNSIIWWDFSDHHNLRLVTKNEYDNNSISINQIKINDNINKKMNIVVTIMDKKGEFYFMCTVPGHAKLGHKIKITVL